MLVLHDGVIVVSTNAVDYLQQFSLALQHKEFPCANPFTKQVVCWLQTEVSKRVVTDYNKFVPPEKEMWVKKINTKLTRSQYASHNEFQKDIFQILKNARA